MDKWILSRLNTLIGQVDKKLDNFRLTESARAIQEFADDLSNWYVRRCRLCQGMEYQW
ncbi:MAG: class I tRNA ligase family protein [Caulobacteraceae bacterium]